MGVGVGMAKVWGLGAAVAVALLSSGCSVATLGSFTGEPPAATPAVAPTAEPAPRPAMGPFLEGPVGSRLTEADRASAFAAETDALTSGDRKTWRGAKGTYGFVAPGSSEPGPDGDCRTFTHTIYFGGRPQVGRGKGCRGADGSWRIVS